MEMPESFRGLAVGPNQPWTDTKRSLGQQLLIDKEEEIMAWEALLTMTPPLPATVGVLGASKHFAFNSYQDGEVEHMRVVWGFRAFKTCLQPSRDPSLSL